MSAFQYVLYSFFRLVCVKICGAKWATQIGFSCVFIVKWFVKAPHRISYRLLQQGNGPPSIGSRERPYVLHRTRNDFPILCVHCDDLVGRMEKERKVILFYCHCEFLFNWFMLSVVGVVAAIHDVRTDDL